jgi:hypothetical protein
MRPLFAGLKHAHAHAQAHAHSHARCICTSLAHSLARSAADASFDVVIDKGTFDALLCHPDVVRMVLSNLHRLLADDV